MPRTIRQLQKDLRSVAKELASTRDTLHDLIADAEELLEGRDEDIDELNRVCENLSKYV